MNLPNAITLARIASTPLLALLPLVESWEWRLVAFVLFLLAAITDYYDGVLARSRGLVTDLGKKLDPLADKLLLIGTLAPMWILMRPTRFACESAIPVERIDAAATRLWCGGTPELQFLTPVGHIGLPLWVVVIVLGREVLMTLFRQLAARRGVVISAIGPAKWKTTLQMIWVGAAYFWFFASTLAAARGWVSGSWVAFADFNGSVGVAAMSGAVLLTLYSGALYLRAHWGVMIGRRGNVAAR
ncbi:MAG: CDP-diacylglycerol--glycerol-3-phosphate 3-phosphatidyltransferase [Gemmatimonadaceae bacterium]